MKSSNAARGLPFYNMSCYGGRLLYSGKLRDILGVKWTMDQSCPLNFALLPTCMDIIELCPLPFKFNNWYLLTIW